MSFLKKLELNVKELYPANSLKNLCINIDENFNQKQKIRNLEINLNRLNAILSKLRHSSDRKSQSNISNNI